VNDRQLLVLALNQLENLVAIHNSVEFDDQVDIDLQAKAVKTFTAYVENVRAAAGLCVTGCDDDCESLCHEEHEIAGIAHKTVAATMRLVNINDEGQYNSTIENQLRTLEELLANLL